MEIRVVYNREVIDDGDFITSADIKASELLKTEDIVFLVEGEKLDFVANIEKGNRIHVNFKKNNRLSTLRFNADKFVNELVLPEIIMSVAGVDSKINVSFKKDSFINDFKKDILQTSDIQLSYSLYSKGDKKNKRPLVIFLHRSGERGLMNDLPLLGNDVPKTIHDYVNKNDDAVILVPQATWAPELNGWFRLEFRQALLKLIKYVKESENIDSKRVYLTGLSNGASATWHLVEKYPDIFAAAIPCSGYIFNEGKEFKGEQGKGRYMLPTKEEVKNLINMPIWAFHGEDDPVVNVKGTLENKKEIEAMGGKRLKVTIYPKGKLKTNPHASWSLAYNNSELLPWLFKQHKE